jgi:hypothetical protein
MAFDFDDVDYDSVINEQIESNRRIHENCIKLEDYFSKLKRCKNDGIWDRKFQEVVYGEVLFYILKDKSLYEKNEAVQEKLLVLSTNIEDMNNDELMSALKDLDDVVTALGLGYIKNSSWTYHDLLRFAILKKMELLF